MSINTKKTKAVAVDEKQRALNIQLEGDVIQHVHEFVSESQDTGRQYVEVSIL